MERSIAIIDSSSRPGRLVAIVELQGQGKPVVAAVEVDGTGSMRGKRIDSNAVASAYSKGNAITSLLRDAIASEANGNGGIYYWDKKSRPNGEDPRGPIPRQLSRFERQFQWDGECHSQWDCT
jgi:hypothetical protein